MAAMGDEALIGRVLDDRYVIGERIARGGMASVFIATDKRLDRVVAVKVMHTGMGDDRQFTERFVREARSAAKLNHPNVVAVFDQGSDGDVTYLVMEYVPGRTLRDVMRDESPMPPRRALALIEQVLIALSAAHAAHIIHRDVKPENVLITPEGETKVADFGLARAVSAATTATGGTLIGTVSYLAPEIVVNEGADARSDVYACGAMLFEMLTAMKPHTGESPIQVAYKHVHEDIASPSQLVGQVPPYVDALVLRATARNRDLRPTDAHVMLKQVRRVRSALASGLDDDRDLTADLLPNANRTADEIEDDTADFPYLWGAAAATAQAVHGSLMDNPTAIVNRGESTMVAEHGLMPTRQQRTGLQPPMGSDQYKTLKRGRNQRRRGPILLIVALILAMLAGFGGWYYGVGRYVETPRLTGMQFDAAKADAKSAGFDLSVQETKFSEEIAKDVVMSTDPAPGDKVLPESKISAVVSKGKERYAVPKLKGKSVGEAKAILAKLNLKVGEIDKKYDEKITKSDIIGTDLKAGSLLKRGESVDLVVSLGRQPINVTDYTGKSEKDAAAGLENAGFTVDVTLANDDKVDKGSVIAQDPKSGQRFRGTTIALTVSLGPEKIDVPNVVDKAGDKAEKVLKKAGFKVKWEPFKVGDARVRSQTPTGKAKPGSTIKLSQVSF